jgi:hypothetical protein
VSPLQIPQTASAKSAARVQSPQFPLSWSHYVRLIPIADVELHLTSGRELFEADFVYLMRFWLRFGARIVQLYATRAAGVRGAV